MQGQNGGNMNEDADFIVVNTDGGNEYLLPSAMIVWIKKSRVGEHLPQVRLVTGETYNVTGESFESFVEKYAKARRASS